jgi:DNA/RNA-binding domain of Phe-tRNA-synthetase-like protein
VPLVAVAPAVRQRFPGLDVRAALLRGVRVRRAPAACVAEAVAEVQARRTLDGLKDDALFRAYRDFAWQLGVDPTKQRPSGEALNRRVLQGKALPRVNDLVDAYNAASLRSGVPISAFDAGKLEGQPELRHARLGEPFASIGGDQRFALEGGELVVADAARVLSLYPSRDAAATKVTEATRDALLVLCGVPAMPAGALEAAQRLAAALVRQACGGEVAAQD